MPLTWLVCGASRGVGKTQIAHGLAAILPDAVRAKLGSARPKLGKPGNYFRDPARLAAFLATQAHRRHVVVEADRTLYRTLGDLVVFLDDGAPATGRADVRRLRRSADLRINAGQDAAAWDRVLAPHLPVALRRRVCALFRAQEAHLRAPPLTPRLDLRLMRRGRVVCDRGLAALAELLAAGDDLRAAAAACSVSPGHARRRLHAAGLDADLAARLGRVHRAVATAAQTVADRCCAELLRREGLA
jgi:hypothetical protein